MRYYLEFKENYLQETDSGRATLTDIFCNTNGFSAKTVQAIYKETLYKVVNIPYVRLESRLD